MHGRFPEPAAILAHALFPTFFFFFPLRKKIERELLLKVADFAAPVRSE